MQSFLVEAGFARVAVTTKGPTVTGIELRPAGGREAATPFERLVERELQEYGAGSRFHFTFPLSPSGTAFQMSVWDRLLAIPYGETRTYGEVARELQKPGAARAVGAANHANPIPIVIPCHRVVATGGGLGGYGGGVALKHRLLALEAAARPALR